MPNNPISQISLEDGAGNSTTYDIKDAFAREHIVPTFVGTNSELEEAEELGLIEPGMLIFTKGNTSPSGYPTANQIALSSITGMDADDVQEGIEELKSDLSDKVTRMSDVSGYQTVDVLGYNPTTRKLGLKVNGADTVIPFSGESIEDLAIDISYTYMGYPTTHSRTVNGEVVAVFWFIGVPSSTVSSACAYKDKYGREYYASSRIIINGSTVTCGTGWAAAYGCGLFIFYKPNS